jgi:arsenate reductase
MTRVIFACVHNAGRSQIAATFFNALADPSKATALSAGTEPASCVHPQVVDAMREIGFDLSEARPRRLTDDLVRDAAVLVTMGCGEACPYVPGLHREDWSVPDPKGQSTERVNAIRDDVRRRVEMFITANGWKRRG